MELNTLHINEYAELLPIALIGIGVGLIGVMKETKDSKAGERSIIRLVVDILSASLVGLIAFTILSATELQYMAKVGISAAISHFGIDRAIEIIKNIINIKK